MLVPGRPPSVCIRVHSRLFVVHLACVHRPEIARPRRIPCPLALSVGSKVEDFAPDLCFFEAFLSDDSTTLLQPGLRQTCGNRGSRKSE